MQQVGERIADVRSDTSVRATMLPNSRERHFYHHGPISTSLIKLAMKSNKPTPKGLTRDLGLQLPFTSYMNWSDHHTSPDVFTKISWFITRPMDPFDNQVKVKDAFSE